MAWTNLVMFAVIATPFLVLGRRPLPDARVRSWMEARGVPVTADTRHLVRRELQRTRRWRAYGVVAVLGIQGLVSGLYAGRYPDAPALVVWLNEHTMGWALPLAGYGIGALAAEWWSARPTTTGRAVVSRRELGDYVSSGLLRMLRWLPVAVVALTPLPLLVPVHPSWGGHGPSAWRILALAVGAVMGWAVAEPLARTVVARHQRIGDPATVRADDALRSTAAHAVVAVGVALQLLALAGALWSIGAAADPKPIRWTFTVGALVAGWTAFGMWFGYAATSFPFVVRRPVAGTAASQDVST